MVSYLLNTICHNRRCVQLISDNPIIKLLTMNRWDALLFGERKWVPSPPATKANVMRTFHRRPPNVVMAQRSNADGSFLERFSPRIRYMINTADQSWLNPATGKTTSCNAMGYTQYLDQFELARITLASQMIGPLLRDDISVSQRLVIQYQTTKTVSREALFCDLELTPQPDTSRVRGEFITLTDLTSS
jgi:hypothetical protein